MERSKLTRIGGAGALIGGTLWAIAVGIAQFAAPQLVGLLAIPTLLLVIGLVGLQRRRATRPGLLSDVSFVVALVGALLFAYGAVGQMALSGDILGMTYGPIVYRGVTGGALLYGTGVALTAISVISANVLPRLSPIPLLLGGIGVATTAALALVRPLFGGPSAELFPFDTVPFALLWVVFGIGWLWLGYLLWSERAPGTTPA